MKGDRLYPIPHNAPFDIYHFVSNMMCLWNGCSLVPVCMILYMVAMSCNKNFLCLILNQNY